MLRKDLGQMNVMGFARYRAKDGADPSDLIAAARSWQKDFLSKQPGIALHCFLQNQSGDFADAILAVDEADFAAMSEAHLKAESSRAFMDLLDLGSIRLCKNLLLQPLKCIPESFACIEFGTFRAKAGAGFSEKRLLSAAYQVRQDYLSNFPENRAHLIGKVEDETYSEICFVETSGAAREICGGYMTESACQPLLSLFDPKSVDLDFWHVLA